MELFLHQSFPREEMAALYLAADVMLVTALRDGMNLVAKEYVAAGSTSGALMLASSPAPPASCKGAVLVNPHDIDGIKDDHRTRRSAWTPAESVNACGAAPAGPRRTTSSRWSGDFLAALSVVR